MSQPQPGPPPGSPSGPQAGSPSGPHPGQGTAPAPRQLPRTAGQTSPEQPWPVRMLTLRLGDYLDKAPALWVEGQVVQLVRRPGQPTCYLTLRDPDVDMSFQVTVHARVLDSLAVPLVDGTRVVLHARAQLWPKRGTLSLAADDIRPVGVGELLARIEHLRRLLAAEGLFAAERKKPLPFLPRVVGLVCGRASAAERDVVENARRRWAQVRFDVRAVAIQGPQAVTDIVAALQALDAEPRVDVIVLARGGGSLEDLLPFSNETLLRAVAACAHARGQRDRSRGRLAAGGPRGRRALLHADRRRTPRRPGRGRRAGWGGAGPGKGRHGVGGSARARAAARGRAARATRPRRPAPGLAQPCRADRGADPASPPATSRPGWSPGLPTSGICATACVPSPPPRRSIAGTPWCRTTPAGCCATPRPSRPGRSCGSAWRPGSCERGLWHRPGTAGDGATPTPTPTPTPTVHRRLAR